MPVSKRIIWGQHNPLHDPRLANLEEILKAIRDHRPYPPHVASGGIFQNRDADLPLKPYGYYHEYYLSFTASGDRDKLRLILGESGEIYISGDHYHDFRQIINVPS